MSERTTFILSQGSACDGEQDCEHQRGIEKRAWFHTTFRHSGRKVTLSVDATAKSRVLDFLSPIFLGIGSFVKLVYSLAFAWWLDPWMQGKEGPCSVRRFAGELLLSHLTDAAGLFRFSGDSPISTTLPSRFLGRTC